MAQADPKHAHEGRQDDELQHHRPGNRPEEGDQVRILEQLERVERKPQGEIHPHDGGERHEQQDEEHRPDKPKLQTPIHQPMLSPIRPMLSRLAHHASWSCAYGITGSFASAAPDWSTCMTRVWST